MQMMFVLQSHAEEDYLKQNFHETRKGSMKVADYLRVMKTHPDNIIQVGGDMSGRSIIS